MKISFIAVVRVDRGMKVCRRSPEAHRRQPREGAVGVQCSSGL